MPEKTIKRRLTEAGDSELADDDLHRPSSRALPTRCPPFSTYQRRRRPARQHWVSSEPFGPQLARSPRAVAGPNQGGNFSLSLMIERQRCRLRRNVHHLPIHPLRHPPDGLQRYASTRIGHRNLRRHVEP
jgi:hypothetical protein